MESRRIRLLSECYLNGWLDFKKRTRTSLLRENYLLDILEQELLGDMLHLKTVKDSSIVAGIVPHNAKVVALPLKHYNEYLRLRLPYLHKNSNIESEEIDKKELEQLKTLLAQGKKQVEDSKVSK